MDEYYDEILKNDSYLSETISNFFLMDSSYKHQISFEEENAKLLLQITVDDKEILNSYLQSTVPTCKIEFLPDCYINSVQYYLDIPDNINYKDCDKEEVLAWLQKSIANNGVYRFKQYNDLSKIEKDVINSWINQLETSERSLDLSTTVHLLMTALETYSRALVLGNSYVDQFELLSLLDAGESTINGEIKQAASEAISRYRHLLQDNAENAAYRASLLLLSNYNVQFVSQIYYAIFTAGLSMDSELKNLKHEMNKEQLLYAINFLDRVSQVSMTQFKKNYNEILDYNNYGYFSETGLNKLRNSIILLLRTNLRKQTFMLYYFEMSQSHSENDSETLKLKNGILDYYDLICRVMDTDSCDNLLLLEKFSKIFSAGFGSIRQKIHPDIMKPSKIYPLDNFYSSISSPNNNATTISSAYDLYTKIQNNPSGDFVLTDDIDLESFNDGNWIPLCDWEYGEGFSGSLDGQGHGIQNLKVTGTEYAGLFHRIEGGTIKNLRIEATEISGFDSAGILSAYGNGKVYNCQFSCPKVFAHDLAGGVFAQGGWEYPVTIQNVSVSANISTKSSDYGKTGGFIAGYCHNVKADHIVFNGDISCIQLGGLSEYGHLYAGGIIGDPNGSLFLQISDAQIEGTILAKTWYGEKQTFDSGTGYYLGASTYAGGLIGSDSHWYGSGNFIYDNQILIDRCNINADIVSASKATSYAGGFLGNVHGLNSKGYVISIANSTLNGLVKATAINGGVSCAGGALGSCSASVLLKDTAVTGNVIAVGGNFSTNAGHITASGKEFLNMESVTENIEIKATNDAGIVKIDERQVAKSEFSSNLTNITLLQTILMSDMILPEVCCLCEKVF